MTKSLMPQSYYQNVGIFPEDELVLAFALNINYQHQLLLHQTELEVRDLFEQLSQKKLGKEKYHRLSELLARQDVLHKENISDAENLYGIYVVAQRLFFEHRHIINEIKEVRDSSKYGKTEKQKLIEHNYAVLKAALVTSSNDARAEIINIGNRQAIIERIYESFKQRGLLKQVKIDIKQGHKYFSLTVGAGELVASACRVLLILTRHLGHFYNTIPLFGGGFVLLGTLATLLVTGYDVVKHKDEIDTHIIVSNIMTIVAGFLNVTSYGLQAIHDLSNSSFATGLVWAPFIGTAATLLMLGVEVGGIIRTEVRYTNSLELYKRNLVRATSINWLQSTKDLSEEELDLRKSILNHLSLNDFNTNPDAIKGLFTKDEFLQKIAPRLLKHAKNERRKLVTRHTINSSILFILVTTGMVAFFLPAIALPIAFTITASLIAAFFIKLVLYETVLKAKKNISIDYVEARLDIESGTFSKNNTTHLDEAGVVKINNFMTQFDKAVRLGLRIDDDLLYEAGDPDKQSAYTRSKPKPRVRFAADSSRDPDNSNANSGIDSSTDSSSDSGPTRGPDS